MTARDFQLAVAEVLNGCEELVQGGCKAFAEDTRTVYRETEAWLAAGKVSLVVVTPELERNGQAKDGIPAETKLQVQASERPQVTRAQQGVMTALDAADAAMRCLDGRDGLAWLSTRQTYNPRSGTLTATATFAAAILLTPPDSGQPPTANR